VCRGGALPAATLTWIKTTPERLPHIVDWGPSDNLGALAGPPRACSGGVAMKILITVDGSEYTQKAVNFYLDHKQSFGKFGSVTLLHVSAPLPRLLSASLTRQLVESHHAEELANAMNWARTRFAQYEVAFAEKADIGEAAAKICAIAEQDAYDLIIIGSRGHGTVPGLAMGSTALKVLGGCRVPLLVIR
jgi:nucleotide-binding universal stress UspA family protein